MSTDRQELRGILLEMKAQLDDLARTGTNDVRHAEMTSTSFRLFGFLHTHDIAVIFESGDPGVAVAPPPQVRSIGPRPFVDDAGDRYMPSCPVCGADTLGLCIEGEPGHENSEFVCTACETIWAQAAVRAVAPPPPSDCSMCAAKDFQIAALQDSIDGCAKRVAELAARLRAVATPQEPTDK